MKILLTTLLLAGCSFFCGCHREAMIPSDSFRMTVQEVVSDSDIKVSLLTIHVSHAASISVDGGDSHNQVVLPDAQDGAIREGQVLLSAARVAPTQDKSAYIQTLIRPKTRNGFAGGAGVTPVPADTTLASFFPISAMSGIYKLDTPIIIAEMQGKPVTMVVGKPTK